MPVIIEGRLITEPGWDDDSGWWILPPQPVVQAAWSLEGALAMIEPGRYTTTEVKELTGYPNNAKKLGLELAQMPWIARRAGSRGGRNLWSIGAAEISTAIEAPGKTTPPIPPTPPLSLPPGQTPGGVDGDATSDEATPPPDGEL